MIEAVREGKKSRRPQPDKDAKTFGVPLRVSRLTTREKPDGNGADDGGKTKNKAEFTQKFEMSWLYHFTVNRSRRETVARFVFKNQQGANFLLDILLIRKPIVQEHGAVGACSSPAVVETRFAVRYWHQVEVEREVESVTRT